jgi:K+-sensing histidine kinase KdpD
VIRYDKKNKKLEKLEAELAKLRDENHHLNAEVFKVRAVLDSTMHEVRRFSGEMSRMSEELSKDVKNSKPPEQLFSLAQSIFYTSGMIAARLNYSDIELNPEALHRQTTYRAGIYKKFEKSKHALERQAWGKHVKIRFNGGSFSEIDAIQAFELVPFVILDNAIKYSPDDQDIEVSFEDEVGNKHATVRINSLGPRLLPGEVDHVFVCEFRGQNAQKIPGYGAGLGLYLAKRLCEIHGVEISVAPGDRSVMTLNSIDYSEFEVALRWRR